MAKSIQIDENIFDFIDKEKPNKYPFKVFCNLCGKNLVIRSSKAYLQHINNKTHIQNHSIYTVPSKFKKKRKTNDSRDDLDKFLDEFQQNNDRNGQLINYFRQYKKNQEEKDEINEHIIFNLKNEIEKLKSRCAELEDESIELKVEENNEIEALNRLLNERHDQIIELETNKIHLELKLSAKESQFKEISEIIDQLNKEKDELIRNIKEKDLIIKDLEISKSDFEANYQESSKKYQQFTVEVDTLIEKLKHEFNLTIDQQNMVKIENYSEQFDNICHDIGNKYQKINEKLNKTMSIISFLQDKISNIIEMRNLVKEQSIKD